MGINDDIRSNFLAHEVGLERYRKKLIVDLLKILGDADHEIEKELAVRINRMATRGFDTGPVTTNRLRALQDELRRLIRDQYRAIGRAFKPEMLALAEHEASFPGQAIAEALSAELKSSRSVSLIRASGGVLEISFIRPGAAQLVSLVESKPFQGRLMGEWFQDLAADKLRRLDAVVKNGFVTGRSIPQMTRDLEAQGFEYGRRQLTTFARTATSDIANGARSLTYEENADILRGERWTGTFDSRICEQCVPRDGHVYEIGTHKPLDGGPPYGAGPGRLHANDRCTSTPETKSWQELGINLSELPEGLRASEFGPVKGVISAEEWLRQHPAAAERVYGKARAQLFLRGGLSAERLINDDGELWTLDTLRGKAPRAFKLAGLEVAA